MLVYEESGRIIDTLRKKNGSIKSLVLTSKYKNKKQLFALVCETLKYGDVLDKIIETSRLMKMEKVLKSQTVAQVLLYDFLIGKGIREAGKYKVALNKHKAALRAEFARLKIKAKAVNNEDLLSENVKSQVKLPRYVRVNLLKTCFRDVVQHFTSEGYKFHSRRDGTDYQNFIDDVEHLKKKHFMEDYHMTGQLLVFPAGTDLHDHVLYQSGDIVLQDKASCLPAFVLSPTPGSQVIDCCAAPGNKTSHAAAILQNKGKIFAFDMDARRLSTMNTLMLKAGVTSVKLNNNDFLTVDPNDKTYEKVEYFIVDPSCSGSGIVNRQDHLMKDNEESGSKDRLENLAKFQMSIVKHALSFPSATRVVYSTCSVHEEENERVVREVLQDCGDRFELQRVLPSWENRGHSEIAGGDLCIRASPDKDLTNGFFVACFAKKEAATTECDVCASGVSSNADIGVKTEDGVNKKNKDNDTEERLQNRQLKRKNVDAVIETEPTDSVSAVISPSHQTNVVGENSSKKRKRKKKNKKKRQSVSKED